jgi:nucleoside-diphosphate-sugar epimerase
MIDPNPVVVLGGSGFLGRHICQEFANAAPPVTSVTSVTSMTSVISVARRPVAIPGVRSVTADLATADLADLLGALRPRIVVNAAGGVWGVTEDQLRVLNVTLVERLAGAMAAQPEVPRLVHLGSIHEYGAVPAGRPITTAMTARPISSYGRTKLIGTQTVLDAVRAGELDGIVLRVASVSGPGTPAVSMLGQVAGQLAKARREGGTAELRLGSLRVRRDYVDVRDVASAIRAAAFVTAPASAPAVASAATAPAAVSARPDPVATDPMLNIGRGEAVGMDWLVRELIRISGVPATVIQHQDDWQATGRGTGIDWQQMDIGPARLRLGWHPRYSLSESLAALWSQVSGPVA